MALFPFLNTNRSRTDNSTVNASVQTVKRREDEKAADKKPSLDYSENDSFSQPTRNNPVVNTRETSTEAARPVMGGAGRSWDVAPERGATRNFEPTAMPEAAQADMGNNAGRMNSVSGANSPVVAQPDTAMGGAGRSFDGTDLYDTRGPARIVSDVVGQVLRLPQSIAQGVNKITGAVPSLAEAHGLSSSPETMIMNQMGRQDAFSYFHEALSGADSTPTIGEMGRQLNIDLERQAQAVTPAAVDIYSQTANQFVDVVGEAAPAMLFNILTTGSPVTGGLGAGAGGLQAISTEMWEGSGDPNKALAKGAIAFGAEMLGNKVGKIAGEVIGTGAAGKAADIVMEGLEENIEGVANAVAFGEPYTLKEAIRDNIFGTAAGGFFIGTMGNISSSDTQARAAQPTANEVVSERPSAVKGDDVVGRVLNMPGSDIVTDNAVPKGPQTQSNVEINPNPTPIDDMRAAIEAYGAKLDSFAGGKEFASESVPIGEFQGFKQNQSGPQLEAVKPVQANETVEHERESTDQPASNIIPLFGGSTNTKGKSDSAYETQGDLALQPERSTQSDSSTGRKWRFDPGILPLAPDVSTPLESAPAATPDVSQDTDTGDATESQDTATEETARPEVPEVPETTSESKSDAQPTASPNASPVGAPELKPNTEPNAIPAVVPSGLPGIVPSPTPQPQPEPTPEPTPQPQPRPVPVPTPAAPPTPNMWPNYSPAFSPWAMPGIAAQPNPAPALNPAPAIALALEPLKEPAPNVALQPATEPALDTNLSLQIPDQDRDDKLPEYNSNLMRGQGATGEVFETMGYNQSFGIMSSG